MKKIKILQVVPNMHAAGLETLIMNIYRNIDRSVAQFDFLVHYKERHFYDDEIEKLGGHIYRFTLRDDNNIVKYIRDLELFFSTHKYDIVHGHMASTACFYLRFAKKYNVPIRILHSHNTSTEKKIKGKLKYLLLQCSTIYANHFFACGEEAGSFLFKDKKFTVIHNAIDFNVFKKDTELGCSMRKKYNLENCFVIGHIGRFNTQKNHVFLVELFEKIHDRIPGSRLVLVGEGELYNDVQRLISKKKLMDCVTLLGVQKDTNAFYNMFDIFLLPSLFEGLPVVGIESQATGCRTIISDKVTDEIKITELVKFMPIDGEDSIKKWCDIICECFNNKTYKCDVNIVRSQLSNAGYNIIDESQRLLRIYKKLLEE